MVLKVKRIIKMCLTYIFAVVSLSNAVWHVNYVVENLVML